LIETEVSVKKPPLFNTVLQLLPEKYSYFRRVVREDSVSVDCVICMTAVDTVQRASEYMVSGKIHVDI
jgi:hypothetical protein